MYSSLGPVLVAGPEQVSRALGEALAARQLDAAAACFTRDACFITPDATEIHGRGEIRQILAQLIGAGAGIEVVSSSVLQAGEVALGSECWRIHQPGVNGRGPFERICTATVVLHAVEGDWKLAVAAPWGWGPERG